MKEHLLHSRKYYAAFLCLLFFAVCLLAFPIQTIAQARPAQRERRVQIFFTYSPTRPAAQQEVKFQVFSRGNPTSWLWDFGDSETSILQNPSHTFAAPGSYRVTLTAGNSSSSGKVSRTLNVILSSSASFTYSPSYPITGQTLQFTDTSTGGPTSWQWNFGDGTTATSQKPSHTYTTAASYTVTLTVAFSSGSKSVSHMITVAPALAASFIYTPTSPVAGQAIQFTDTSTGSPTSWQWSFGDGATSNSQNPSHAYTTAASYTVTLTVVYSSVSKSVSQTITVLPPSVLNASFTYSPSSAMAGQAVQFIDTSTGGPTSWLWNFGDNTTSNSKNPSHTYTAAGSYTVTLTVTNSSGSKSVSQTITVLPSSALTASFTYSPSFPVAGQAVQFTDTSTGNPTSWQWSFGDGTTSTSQNPSHAYTAAGSYTVTLTVANSSGSKSVTQTITITPEAAGYYIDTNNPIGSDSNPGTAALPWKSISKANQTLVAGDTVYVKAGTYSTYIAPINSGTSASYITYKNYGSDNVTIQNASYGIRIDGKSYIKVQGINFYNLDRFMYLENSANHNIIAYCNFDQMRNSGAWAGSRIWKQSSHNWVHHCRFSKYGACTGAPPNGDDSGVVLEIGNEESMTSAPQIPDFSNYNLIENNVMYHGGHHVLGVMGQFNVIRNNYLHNEGWSQARGNRTLYMNGYAIDTGWNLIEGNRFAYTAPPCDGTQVSGVQITSNHNIFRFNSFFFNDQSGLQFSESSSYYQDTVYNHVYNNTFFRNSLTSEPDPGNAAVYFAVWSGSLVVKYNTFKNNLYYGHPTAYGVYRASLGDQTFVNEFNGDILGDPRFVNAPATPGDPMNADYPDFHLSGGSPGIDKGGALTTITSPSGSGTTFTVADARYFMDGWWISGVDGDDIQIVGTSQKARIINVNYETNTITVNTTLIWTQNQGVALAYVGAAPDVGAYEYGSTKLSSALQGIRKSIICVVQYSFLSSSGIGALLFK